MASSNVVQSAEDIDENNLKDDEVKEENLVVSMASHHAKHAAASTTLSFQDLAALAALLCIAFALLSNTWRAVLTGWFQEASTWTGDWQSKPQLPLPWLQRPVSAEKTSLWACWQSLSKDSLSLTKPPASFLIPWPWRRKSTKSRIIPWWMGVWQRLLRWRPATLKLSD